MQGRSALIDVDIFRRHFEFSAVRHGVTSVDHEIHDDHMDLAGVGHGLSHERIECSDEFDVLSKQTPKHLFCIVDDGVYIQRSRSRHDSAQGQQSACQVSTTLPGLVDLRGLRM